MFISEKELESIREHIKHIGNAYKPQGYKYYVWEFEAKPVTLVERVEKLEKTVALLFEHLKLETYTTEAKEPKLEIRPSTEETKLSIFNKAIVEAMGHKGSLSTTKQAYRKNVCDVCGRKTSR